MTSHSDDTATDNNRATVANTVATVSDDIGDGAVATVATASDGATVIGNGKVPPATPADMSSLDSRVLGNDGAVVATDTATDDDRATVAGTAATVGATVGNGAIATVTVTNPDDAIIATNGNAHKSSFP